MSLSVRKLHGKRIGSVLRFSDMNAYFDFHRLYRDEIDRVRVVPPVVGGEGFGEMVVTLKPDCHVVLKEY
jgi:hypothetical protein